MKKKDAYNEDEFVHDVLDFLVAYNKDVKQFVDNFIELRKRVDTAIEYIENDLKSFLYSIEYKTLLDILKGSDEE